MRFECSMLGANLCALCVLLRLIHPVAVQGRAQELPRGVSLHRGDLLRRAGGDDVAALLAPFGAEVDDPVGRFHYIDIMFDHCDRVAQIDEAAKHGEKLLDVVEVQPGRRFVEDVKRLAGIDAAQLAGQLDSLGLAAA